MNPNAFLCLLCLSLIGFTTNVEAQNNPGPRTPGDTCTAATLEVSGIPFMDSSTTVGETDDYVYGLTCFGFNEMSGIGPDLAYRIRTDLTCDITVEVDPLANDLALFVLTDCDNAATCVGGDDSNGSGFPEQVSFTATAGTEYFIVVDGFNGASDAFDLTVTEDSSTGCQLVPVELQSFSIE